MVLVVAELVDLGLVQGWLLLLGQNIQLRLAVAVLEIHQVQEMEQMVLIQ
jgi:hypothetical protein